MKKLTNVSALEMVLGFAEVQKNAELVEKLTTMKNQFEKKNNSTGLRKPTKTQEQNAELIEIIYQYLAEVMEEKTITDLMNSIQELEGLSNQKVSSLLKKLVDTDRVEKTLIKRKTYFQAK